MWRVPVHTHAHMHSQASAMEVRGQFGEVSSLFPPCVSQNGTQVTRLGHKHLYSVSHLGCPQTLPCQSGLQSHREENGERKGVMLRVGGVSVQSSPLPGRGHWGYLSKMAEQRGREYRASTPTLKTTSRGMLLSPA